MRRLFLIMAAVSLVAAACGGTTDTTSAATTAAPVADTGATTTGAPATTASPTTAPPATTAAPTTAAPTTTGEPATPAGSLVVAAVNFSSNEIVLRNDGSEPYDLTGHWLCNRPAYAEIPAQTLAPGESVTIPANVISLSADGGEVAVYTSNDFGSADAMVRYVRWGSASGGRSGVAVAAGLWQEGDFVDNGGADITLTGDPTTASGWSS